VKILPKRSSEGGLAAFVDFVDIKSAQKAHNGVNRMGDRELRTDYNEPERAPGTVVQIHEEDPATVRQREMGYREGGVHPYGPAYGRYTRFDRRSDG